MSPAMQPRRPTRPAIRLALLAALLAVPGCGASTPEPPSASDGLAYLLPTSEGGTDLALVRLSDGSARMLTETPTVSKGNLLWSPAVQRLVFTQPLPDAPPGSSRIMLFDIRDGSIESASERVGAVELDVSISPDGRRLVYVFETLEGGGFVKILRLMTSGESAAGAPLRGTVLRRPRLSPNGSDVVAEVRARNKPSGIVLLLPDGGQRPIVDDGSHRDGRPRFSRGGETIYFERAPFERPRQRERRIRAGVPGPLGGGDVCGVDVETLAVRCIAASEDAQEHGIEPSPTRDEVAFVRRRPGGEAVEVVLADASGEKVQVLATVSAEDAGSLSWSPDGERLAFVSGSVSGSDSGSGSEPGDAAPDGDPSLVTRITVIDRTGRVLLELPGFAPTWAPPVEAPAAP